MVGIECIKYTGPDGGGFSDDPGPVARAKVKRRPGRHALRIRLVDKSFAGMDKISGQGESGQPPDIPFAAQIRLQ